MNAQPFKPFRIHMSDGSSLEVANHDAAWVTREAIEVGLDLDNDGFANRVSRCAILHIAKIEDLQTA